MRKKQVTKKMVVACLRGYGDFFTIYKGVTFKNLSNDMTHKEANEHIKDRLENYIGELK